MKIPIFLTSVGKVQLIFQILMMFTVYKLETKELDYVLKLLKHKEKQRKL